MTIFEMCYRGVTRNEQVQAEGSMQDIEVHFECYGIKKTPYREIAKYFIMKYINAVNTNRALYAKLKRLDPGVEISSTFGSDLVILKDTESVNLPEARLSHQNKFSNAAQIPNTPKSKMEARYEAMRNGTIKPRKVVGDKEAELIKQMKSRKMRVEDIADKLGISVSTVYRKLKD